MHFVGYGSAVFGPIRKGRATMRNRTGCLVKRGGTYYVQWVVEGRMYRKTTGTGDRRKAEEARASIMAPFALAGEIEALEAVKGRLEGRKAELAQLEDERNPPTPVAKAWMTFMDDPTRPDSGTRTLNDYAVVWDRFKTWMEARRKGAALRDVTEADAAAYAANLQAAVGASTFNKHLATLRLVFRTLRKTAKLTGDPFEGIRRKRFAVESRRELTVDELRTVCQSATGELRTLLAIGLYCGLRLGDAVTLQWGEVDLVRGRIVRIPHKTARRKPVPVKVPIHPALAEMLTETPKASRRGPVLPGLAERHERDPSAVSKAVTAHFKACGIETGRKVAGRKKMAVAVGFHSLRHSFVSLCREAGAPLSVVEKLVGHSSPAMTLHYSHASEEATRDAVLLLPSVTAKALPAPEPKDGQEATTADELREALAKVRAIAARITADTWAECRRELEALSGSV